MTCADISTPFRSRGKVNPIFQGIVDRINKPGRVLDLGCNTGTDIIYATQQGWTAEGCDIDAEAIAEANRFISDHCLSHVWARAISIQDFLKVASLGYDLVTAIDTLHHIPPQEMSDVLKSIGEIVSPGGIVLLRVFTILECIVTQRPDRTFFDQCDLESAFSTFKILRDRWTVFNDPGHVGRPKFHQHHVEVFIAQKQ